MKRFFWVVILSLMSVLLFAGATNASLVGETGVTFEKQYERAKKEGCKAFYQAGAGGTVNPSRDSQECDKAISRKDKSNGKIISNAQEWLLTKCTAYAKVDHSRGNITTSTDNSKKCLAESKKQGFAANNTVDAQDQITQGTQLGTSQQKEEGGGGGKKDNTSCEVQWVGFVVCPGARIGTAIVINLYNVIAKNLLEIKAGSLFRQGNPAYKTWNDFRNIANVLLAIVVAVVIFSQTTNVGISNYGIKRMLPRIIPYAVIINISFWAVAALVDLSNLLGYNFYMWLGASGGWDAAKETGGMGDLVNSILTGSAEIAGFAAVTAVLVATVAGGSILVLLLLAGLALLLMFVILTGRQAVVVMLVVISPIAFVSSILPNTEGFYKKWKGFLKAMLMIYPICSLMIGGMILASNVLYGTADNALFKMIYGLLPIVGLFAAAAVIKGVASVLDNLTGTKTFSKALAKTEGAKSAVKNSPISNAERRFWGSKRRNYMENLEAKKPNSKRVRAIRAWQNLGNRATRGASELANDNKKFQNQQTFDVLNRMEEAGNLTDPGLSRERNRLQAEFNKEQHEQHQSEGAIIASNMAGNTTKYNAAFQNIKDGDDFGNLAAAIHSDTLLENKDRAELMKALLMSVSADVANKSKDTISRVMSNYTKKYEDSDPSINEMSKKLYREGTARLDHNDLEGFHGSMSAERVAKLSLGEQKARTQFMNTSASLQTKNRMAQVDNMVLSNQNLRNNSREDTIGEIERRANSQRP
ncbi:MAG: hypothetical protein Q4A21_02615 [bacterium]|nr:hypothetical protein [bacterium]